MPNWMKSGGAAGVVVALVVAFLATGYSVAEEAEVGTVSGVASGEDGKPFSKAEIYIETYAYSADLDGFVTFRTQADEQGRFVLRNVPVGFATLRAYAPGYSAHTSLVVATGESEQKVALTWQGDELQIKSNQPVFSPGESPRIVMEGLTRRTDVAVKVFGFSDDEIFESRNVYRLARNISRNWYAGGDETEDAPDPVALKEIKHSLTSRDKHGRFAETLELPRLEEGVYVVRAEVDGVVRHQWINVSRLGLITKVSPKGVTGFVVNIESGEPVPNVALDVVGPKGRRAVGRTAADGTVTMTGGPGENGDYVLLARDGGSKAFAMYYWWQDTDGQLAATHVTTDRTIYRPGDEVQFKGFVRTPTPDGYRLPTARTVNVSVYDPDDTQIETESLPLNAMGGFDGSFRTIPELTGSYRLQTEIDGQEYNEWIPIAAYRKPEFRITVTPEEKFYLRGQSARFRVKVEYFTGEPVVGTELSAWASRADVYRWSPFDDEDYEWWAEEGDYSYGGDFIGDFMATTDEKGEAVISVPTKQAENVERPWWWTDSDQVYTLRVSGQDASGRFFEGTGKVDVVRGAMDLSVAFEDYVVAPGAPVNVRLRGNRVGSDAPAAGAVVTLEFGERVWTGKKTRDRKRGEQKVTLDERGEATVSFRPATPGDFYAKATTQDSGGRRITDQDTLWVYQHGARFGGPSADLQLVLDKKQYAVGDTVTAVVRTDKPGGSALVTVESDDVLWSRVVKLEGEATTVTIPVTRQCRPNATVQVCYIREKGYNASQRNLVIDMGEDRLDVQITPDRDVVLPGGVVSYIVSTKDAQGRPVQADVAVSVVDEGIYAIKEDDSDPLKSFYPRRWTSVSTYFSFPEIYLDGDDKSGVDAQVRTEFRDTAHWAPSVVTGPDGTAFFSVQLPENLTSWRATATAVTADAKAGKGRSDVVARKPVMVRLSPPAFMVQDEVQTIGATVSNETGQAQDFEVRLQTEGLDVTGAATRSVTIGSRGSQRVLWQIKAGKPGRANVRVTAVAASTGQNDALEMSFDVKTNGPTLTSYYAGDTTSRAVFTMDHNAGAIGGTMNVSLTPSILGTVLGSLDGLVDYPYGCVEQTMSRFMPAVVVRQLLRSAGISRPDLDAKIERVSEQSQARLRTMQNSDGGFGWWTYDQGDPDMTAYVLEGLYHAEQAGSPVNAHMRDRAIVWSKAAVKNSGRVNDADVARGYARLSYALSLHGVNVSEWQMAVPAVELVKDDSLTLSYIVLAVSATKGNAPDALKKARADAYAQLIKNADETESAMSWPGEWWSEPTAVALQAVLAMEPSSARPAKVLRYLTGKRRGDMWTSTRETAQVVIGAVEYLKRSNEARPAFQATVRVNGNEVGKYSFGPGDVSRQETVTVPVSALRGGQNEVEVVVEGQGRAYFSAKLEEQVYDPNPRPRDSGHGLTIKREYFRMRSQKMEDGTIRLVPSPNAVTSAKAGEVLHCRLTVTSDKPRDYVMVADPAFSGARAIELGDLEPWNWHYWWSNQSYLDDHTAIFMSQINVGANILEYTVRAEAVGNGIALPATVSMMYQPDVRASTGTAKLAITQ
ncbi:MAG: alpha-2-macroglobulin family protein [Fimbriimonadaceae bacterium]